MLYFYKRVLRSIKPDIVFTYTIKPNIYGEMACSRLKIPYVATITGLGTAVEKNGVLQRICLFLYKIGLRKAKKVFFQNSENMTFMKKHKIIKSESEIIPGSGVNLNQYKLLDYPNSNIVHFAFISRVMKEKGIEQFIDAAIEIQKKYKSTEFHVYGYADGDYKARLVDFDQKGIVFYHGFVRDMTKLYENISCTIHPSFYPEGMSNVLLESIASGRPVITTDRSGCREIVDNGVNGYLVKPLDSNDLIDKIEKFLNLSWEQKREMGINGRKKAEKEFDRNIVVKKYVDECFKK